MFFGERSIIVSNDEINSGKLPPGISHLEGLSARGNTGPETKHYPLLLKVTHSVRAVAGEEMAIISPSPKLYESPCDIGSHAVLGMSESYLLAQVE